MQPTGHIGVTPMGSVNPVTATAAAINNQTSLTMVQVLHTFIAMKSGFATGWHNHWELLQLQIYKVRYLKDWFAMGFMIVMRGATYFLNFDGWSQTNTPYLEVIYQLMYRLN